MLFLPGVAFMRTHRCLLLGVLLDCLLCCDWVVLLLLQGPLLLLLLLGLLLTLLLPAGTSPMHFWDAMTL